jgi:polyisoprenoid-binding protein YceI
MKTSILTAALTGLLASAAAAAPLELQPGSRVWLEGDSTLHPFASTSTALRVETDLGPWEDILKGKTAKLEVTVPVESLKSGEKRLDKNLYAALKAAEFPEIRFRLEGYAMDPSGAVTAQGRLSIAGKENPVELRAQASSKDALAVSGSYELEMSDFGVKPPSLMLGAIKVKDRVVVRFELMLAERRMP